MEIKFVTKGNSKYSKRLDITLKGCDCKIEMSTKIMSVTLFAIVIIVLKCLFKYIYSLLYNAR